MSTEGSRLRTTRTVVWTVAGIAAALVLWGLPATIRFLPDAPASFWAMAASSLIVDIPLFGVTRREDLRVRSTLSVCFTFTIFVLWGVQHAIVVQAVAGTVTVLGQRYHPRAGLYLVSRLVCAAAAAELLVDVVVRRPITTQGTGLNGGDLLTFALLAAVWLTVSYGLLAAARMTVSPHGLRQATADLRPDLIGTTAAILVVSPLLTTMLGWWVLIVAAPLFGLNMLSREQMRREQRLSREPVSGTLNRHGLAVGVEELTALDTIEPDAPRAFGVVAVLADEVLTVNRMLGRDMYEKVATVAARRLAEVYGRDRVARVAGEGFFVLIPGLTEGDALAAAEAAAGVVARRIEVDDIPFRLDPAAGVSLSPLHGRDLATLLAKAELAVAEARRRDLRAMLYAWQASAAAARRVEILREVRNTLREPARHDELAVFYQPQVDLRTGRVTTVEALLRWTHPQWGPIRTDDLIEAVEPTEVMHLLTRHVIERAAAQLRLWISRGHQFRVAVNVSVQDLHDPGFIDELRAIIARNAVPPARFTVELTERMLIKDAPRVRQVCQTLAGLGFGLSLDDFGTGYASLQQLRQLPLTEVKVDRSYVSGVVDNPADRAIITSVHQLARTLGVAVVAEGVEDERTARALAALPGTIGQGYYFGRPMPADALEEWLRSRAPDRTTRLAHTGRMRPSR